MKSISKLLTLAAILLITGITTNVMAQATVTGTSAGASIIAPITLVQSGVLNFGSMSVLVGTGGTCVLPSNSTVRTQTGGVNLSAITPVATNAAYNVTGNKNTTYAVELPTDIVVTETSGGVQVMHITLLKARFNGAAADAITSTLSDLGTDNFTVGGTLTVAAGQLAGTYSGTFNVTVAYN